MTSTATTPATTLVTGAAGFLGCHVARQLVARGESVRVLLRPSSSNRAISDLPLEYVTGDLRDAESLARAMHGIRHVYHVAADYRLWAKKPQDIYDSNVGGTKNLLAAAKQAGIELLIYTSTVATIAVDRHLPGDSSTAQAANSVDAGNRANAELPNEFTDAKLEEMIGHYKRSKWQAEREALEAARNGLPVIVAMPTTPVGPWDWKPTPTGKIIVDFLNGKMPGYVDTGLNFVGVEDCAAGHLLIAERGKIGERYLLGAENLTLKNLLDVLANITGLPAPKLKIPHGLALTAAYAETAFSRLLGREPQIPVEGVKIAQHMMFVDASRAQRELGFQPAPVAAALERAVRWYEANGYVKKSRAKKIVHAAAA
jgi:dihydroflavonol-4-reductase